MTYSAAVPTGGAFLVEEPAQEFIFVPEKFDVEVRLLVKAASDFLQGEVLPSAERLESQGPGLLRAFLNRAAALGLLGIDLPAAYGGLGLAKSVTARLAEVVAVEPSFAVSYNVHTSVASLPILFFGTEAQKSRYLPRLATGEWLGAYALSESHAGTDALAARTRASLAPHGDSYLLHGEKMWITNAALADLFIVFAKVDGELFTAFLVERSLPGLSIGREENKLGLRGSSTCRLILEEVPVPAGNVLGTIGEGAKVALYALNLGRFKIAASSVGQSKNLLSMAARYATQRHSFGRPIAEHGLIRAKLAKMASRIYAAESMLYRVAGYLDSAFADIDPMAEDANARYQAAAEEYAIECALLKVACTETLDDVADENLQIHGGYGYSEEFPAARAWRDARVNRIYEGTNEINRLNVVELLMRRIERGRVVFEPLSLQPFREPAEGTRVPGLKEQRLKLQKTLAAAWQAFPNLPEQQILCGALADMLIASFAWESACLRLAYLQEREPESRRCALAEVATKVMEAETEARLHQNMAFILGACGNKGKKVLRQLSTAPLSLPDTLLGAYEILGQEVAQAGGFLW